MKKNIVSYEVTMRNHNGRGFLAEMLNFLHHSLAIQERLHWRLEGGPLVQITKIRELTPYLKDEFVYRIGQSPPKYGTRRDLLKDLDKLH